MWSLTETRWDIRITPRISNTAVYVNTLVISKILVFYLLSCFPHVSQDMSAYVKKIQFKLHESYGNPLRGEETTGWPQAVTASQCLCDLEGMHCFLWIILHYEKMNFFYKWNTNDKKWLEMDSTITKPGWFKCKGNSNVWSDNTNTICVCTNTSLCLPVVTKPPYEITETGWGEFEIIVKIFFIDPNERPVSA